MGLRYKAILTKWNIYYPKLVNYFNIYGHTNLPECWGADQELSEWVLLVRKDFSSLSEGRKKLLLDLDFITYREWNWLQSYDQLIVFKKKNKHTRIPPKPPWNKLYNWLLLQKQNYEKLSPEKVGLLKQSGVFTDNQEHLEEKWQQRYKELLEYKRRYKDCRVPGSWEKNIQLAKWVRKQRHLKNIGKLIFSRRMLLIQIGFSWSEKDNTLRSEYYDKKWEKKYRMLEAFYKKYGHTLVVYEWTENPTLSRWVGDQRMNYKKKKLSDEKIKRLDKLSFIWNPLEAQWMGKFYLLKAFYQENSHTKIPTSKKYIALAKWVSYMRSRKKELSKGKIALLNTLSFNWKVSAHTQVSWIEMYKQILAFKKKNGHVHISKNDNPKLAKWFYDQRIERVKHSPERRALLKKIGLTF